MRVMTIHLGHALPHASSSRPGQPARKPACRICGALSLFGLAPGGVYHAAPVASRAVRSYRTFSPLPANGPVGPAGGLFSVALSLGSPPPGVTRHRVFVEPGLSSPRPAGGREAAIRPSDNRQYRLRTMAGQACLVWSRCVSRSSSRARVSRSGSPSIRQGRKCR